MKHTLSLISAFLVIALLASPAFAWGPSGKSGSRQGCPGMGNNSQWANLPPEQQEVLGALHQKFIDDTHEARVALMQKRTEAQMMMQTTDPDRNALIRLTEEMADLREQVQKHRIDFQLDAKKIAPGISFGKGYDDCPKGQGSCGRQGQKSDCPYQGQGPRSQKKI